MTSTIIQSLPLIAPAQAQKHVTHNEAMARLDAMVQLSVEDRNRSAPPSGPVAGQVHIVATGATGAWAGKGRNVAVWNGSAWEFHVPRSGWRAYIQTEDALAIYDGSGWFTAAEKPATFLRVGIGADADAANRLTVRSPATLLESDGAGHQLKINKTAAGDTGSVVFQTGYSARAEVGLLGNNDLTVKVSPDGATFIEGMRVDGSTGQVKVKQWLNLAPGSGDPVSPSDGDIWYNAVLGKFRVRQGGITLDAINTGGGGTVTDNGFVIVENADPTRTMRFELSNLTPGTLRTISVPDVSTELVGLAGTQTITGSKTFSDLTLQDGADATKQARFQLSSISPATTRSYALPDGNTTLAGLSTQQIFTARQTFSAASNDFGTATAAGTTNLASGATISGATKTVNIGTGGLSGSTTAVSIGSAVAGAMGSLTINSPTVTFASGVSSIAMASANVSALYLGLGGAVADATNRLSINAPASLFNHAGAGHQMKLNKNAAADTASILWQTGFSGRAEIGTAGSDDLAFKVSADGAAWNTALSLNAATGKVNMPLGAVVTGSLTGTAVTQSVSDTTAGRLLKVGDGGWLTTTPATVALNSAIVSGTYSYASTDPNAPSAAGGALLVMHHGTSTYVVQVAHVGSGWRRFTRTSVDNGTTWSAWREDYNRSNIVGVVSQSAGVPTGAIIETTINANGTYVRYADGTQVCSAVLSITDTIAVGHMGGFRNAGSTWTFPAPFISAPAVTAMPKGLSAFGMAADAVTATAASIFFTSITSQPSASRTGGMMAIGRWF